MFPGLVALAIVVGLIVVEALRKEGAGGGVHVEAGSELQVSNIEVSAASSGVVTVSSHRDLIEAHEWA